MGGACVQEDEEEKLIQQLKEARRRMRKHMKLQVGPVVVQIGSRCRGSVVILVNPRSKK